MEDTLREIQKPIKVENQDVLILVLMEDTLRALPGNMVAYAEPSLNPCFNGRYSQSIQLGYFRAK